MGMPENQQKGMNIAPDGTVYEILDDGTIKRIGKVSSDGSFEPFGDWKCPDCGTENEMKNNFCCHCGAKKSVAKPAFEKSNQASPVSENRNIRSNYDSLNTTEDADETISEDKASKQFLSASFCVPIIGLILGIYYLAKGKPKAGVSCLMAGAASFTLITILMNL